MRCRDPELLGDLRGDEPLVGEQPDGCRRLVRTPPSLRTDREPAALAVGFDRAKLDPQPQ
jgi:hypothetical protein